MSRHAAPRRRFRGDDWKLYLAIFVCLIMFPAVAFMRLNAPDHCDGQAMEAGDLCRHYGRASEELIRADDVTASTEGMNRVDQIGFSNTIGWVFVAAAITVCSAPLWLFLKWAWGRRHAALRRLDG